MATRFRRLDLVSVELRPSTARDDAGPDGTTAFDLSLAHLNAELALAILDSGIEPREDILAGAKEFVNLQLFKTEERALQNAMRSKLGGYIDPTSHAVAPPHCDCNIDERYIHLSLITFFKEYLIPGTWQHVRSTLL